MSARQPPPLQQAIYDLLTKHAGYVVDYEMMRESLPTRTQNFKRWATVQVCGLRAYLPNDEEIFAVDGRGYILIKNDSIY